jgi:hypothetical protein
MQITRQVMDVQRADDLKKLDQKTGEMVPVIQRPKRADEAIISPDNELQQELMADLKKRAQDIKKSGKPEKGMDNMLSVCTDGRKGAVDMRLLNPEAADDPNSKTNQCVRKVLELHAANPGYAQVIFSDLGVHDMAKSKRARVSSAKTAFDDDDEVKVEEDDSQEDSGEASGEDAAEATAQKQMMAGSDKFNLYQDIIGKLVKGGIPREKIADFSQLAGAKKDEACAAMRRGDIVVALGSTKKLGTGTNVQDRLVAMHHLDVPWVPADVEQRDGRGWRHGNILHKEGRPIAVNRYVAEGSLDQMFWQIIANKVGFIKQALSGDIQSMPREMNEESGEELTPEQLMAAASGDPRILEKIQLEDDVKNLRFAEDRHRREQDRARDAAANAKRQLDTIQGHLVGLSQDIVNLEGHKDFYLSIDGETQTDREKATEALAAKVQEIETRWGDLPSWQRYRIDDEEIGEYRGFKLYRSFEKDAPFKLEGPSGLKYPTGDTLRSIENVARGLTHAKEKLEGQAELLEADLKKPVAAGVPFPKASELEEKQKRIKELEAALAPKKEEQPAQGDGRPLDEELPAVVDRKHHAEVDESKITERPEIPDLEPGGSLHAGEYDENDMVKIGRSLPETKARISSQPNQEGYVEVLDGTQVGPFVVASVGSGNEAGYRIYHINSGLHAGRGFKQKNVAKAVAAIMAQKGDWTFTDAGTGFTPETKEWGGSVSDVARAGSWNTLYRMAHEARPKGPARQSDLTPTELQQISRGRLPDRYKTDQPLSFAEENRKKYLSEDNPRGEIVDDKEYFGQRWTYGLQNRPPIDGGAPRGFIIHSDRKHGKYHHGTIDYPYPLTQKEIEGWELEPVQTVAMSRTQLARVGRQPHLHRATGKPQHRLQTQTVSLSRNGAGTMADDPNGKKPPKTDDQGGDDDLDFGDDDLDGGDDDGEGAGNGMPQSKGGKDAELITQLAEALQAKNLVVPNHQDKNLREYVEHLITSLATSAAHEGDTGAGTDDMGGDMAGSNGAAGSPTPEQNSFTMMSRRQAAQDKRILELETELAKGRMAGVVQNIDLATKAGLMEEAEAEGYKAKLKAKHLSLARPGDAEIQVIVQLAERLGAAGKKQLISQGLLGSSIDMSRAQALARPDGQWGKVEMTEDKADECADELVGKRKKAS